MKTVKQILEDEKAPITALLYVITREYGSVCYEWDSLVLRGELQKDYGCNISDLQSDKIQAGITLLTTEQYENNIAVFETINYLLNHQPDNIEEFNPLEPEELICGLTEAYIIKAEEMKFSPEVRVYAGVIFRDYGMHKPPKLFPKAIMQERDGDDTEKNEALQEIFDEKLKLVEQYLKKCIH
jgi:hypothetical protein